MKSAIVNCTNNNLIPVATYFMAYSQFSLLAQRKFLPLFITQALGAFNDNIFKNALIILVTFSLAQQSGHDPRQLVALAGGLFILPFFLFSATAGNLADSYEKSSLIRLIKLAEIIIAAFAIWTLFSQNIYLMLIVLFFLGSQSAFFGPLKYAILPQQLEAHELVGANGLIEGATFLSILIGTIVGGVLILKPDGLHLVSALMAITAVAGYFASRHIPPAPSSSEPIAFSFNIFSQTIKTVKSAAANKLVFSAILADSWFWFMGSVFLAQLPVYTKEILHGDETIVTFFLTLFSIGVGIGALLCNMLLKGETSARLAPWAALAMAAFCADLYFASPEVTSQDTLFSLGPFLQSFSGLRISFDLLAISVAAGLFVVPLFALVQARSKPEFRARIIAADNILSAATIVLSAIFVIVMARFDYSIIDVFASLAGLNLVVAVLVSRIKA